MPTPSDTDRAKVAASIDSARESAAALERAKADEARARARGASADADLAEVEVERRRLEVAFEADERAIWRPTPQLLAKLSKASSQIEMAFKSGHNREHNYDYATFADYLKAVRKPLAENGLFLFQHPVGDPQYSGRETQRGAKWLVARVLIETRIVDPESNGWIACRMWGEGHDPGDKATYKATTGARKYSLAMLLGIHTEDDPERDASPDSYGPKDDPPNRREAPRDQPPPPPMPPADSARPWDAERQTTALKNMASLGPKDDKTAADICTAAAKYLLAQRANGMTPEQFAELRHALLERGEALRQEGLISNEDGTKLVALVADSVAPTTTAAQMPGAEAPATEGEAQQ